MKTTMILIATILGVAQLSHAQTATFHGADSIKIANIETERKNVATILALLKDSLNQSWKTIDAISLKATNSKKASLDKSLDELEALIGKVDLDSAEVTSTAVNSWSKENVARIQMDVASIRKDLDRIRRGSKKSK